MTFVHQPNMKGDLLGLKLRRLKCLDIVDRDENGDPVVDLVEITFPDGVWIAFSRDRKRMFFVLEGDLVPPVTVLNGSLKGTRGVSIQRRRVPTPVSMKG